MESESYTCLEPTCQRRFVRLSAYDKHIMKHMNGGHYRPDVSSAGLRKARARSVALEQRRLFDAVVRQRRSASRALEGGGSGRSLAIAPSKEPKERRKTAQQTPRVRVRGMQVGSGIGQRKRPLLKTPTPQPPRTWRGGRQTKRYRMIARGGVYVDTTSAKGKIAVVDLRTPSPTVSRASSLELRDDRELHCRDREDNHLGSASELFPASRDGCSGSADRVQFPLSPDSTRYPTSHLPTPISDDEDPYHPGTDQHGKSASDPPPIDDLAPCQTPPPAESSTGLMLRTPQSLSPASSTHGVPRWNTGFDSASSPTPTKTTASPPKSSVESAIQPQDAASHTDCERVGRLFAELVMEEDELESGEDEDNDGGGTTGQASITREVFQRQASIPDSPGPTSETSSSFDDGDDLDEVDLELFGYRVPAGHRITTPDISEYIAQSNKSPFKGLSPKRPRPEHIWAALKT